MSTLLTDSKDSKSRKSQIIGRYLEQHALGLAAHLSEIINISMSTNPSAQEGRQCLRAMEEFIRVCRTYVCVARPQVCQPPSLVCFYSQVVAHYGLI